MTEDWKEALAPTPECIDVARLDEELSAAERTHVEECVRCQTELRLFREVMGEQTSPSSQWIAQRLAGRAKAPRRRPFTNVLYAVAATLVLLTGAATWMRHREPSIDLSLSGTSVYRSVRVDIVAPRGEVAQAPGELRWKPVPGATTYGVRILEVDTTQLWSAATTGTSIALPDDVSAHFKPGKLLQWQVTAYRGNESLATSETQNVRVIP